MFLAMVFVLTAAMLLAMSIRKKEERLLLSVGALLTDLVSLTIWLPCLSEICTILKVREITRIIIYTIAILVIVIVSIVSTIIFVKKKV